MRLCSFMYPPINLNEGFIKHITQLNDSVTNTLSEFKYAKIGECRNKINVLGPTDLLPYLGL